MKKIQCLICFSIFGLLLTGCETTSVKAWEKEHLAKRTMTLSAHGLRHQLRSHIQFSKEGSRGGSEASAGGCGCN